MKLLIHILSLILLFSACTPTERNKTLKLAHVLDPTHPVHKGMEVMAQKVKEKSNGQLCIDIYPSGQLGSEQQCVELLQIGSLAITKVSASVLESFTDNYQVLSLPYIFESKEHAFKVLDGEIGKELLESTEPYKIRGLCFFDAGARSFYSIKQEIDKPSDLEGMKIRVMKSQTAITMVKEMGGSPTPISAGEIYTALQSGVIDGAENNPPSFQTSRHYEVCKHYNLNEHTRVPDVAIISTVVWNSLSSNEKKWLQEAANESVIAQREFWAKSEMESIEIVKAAGVQVTFPDKKPFAASTQRMLDSYRDKPKLFTLVQKIRQAAKN